MDEKMINYRAQILARKTGKSMEHALAQARRESIAEEKQRKENRRRHAAEKGIRMFKKMKQDRKKQSRTSSDALNEARKSEPKLRSIVSGGAFELGKRR